jgi:hypothetical protein|tara:strand:+ start:104300 stop:104473 length:174 start_codon:yes stop_codon:yes gene_type:complete
VLVTFKTLKVCFPLSVGVANIAEHLSIMRHRPRYQTTQPGGLGFAEMASFVLSARRI